MSTNSPRNIASDAWFCGLMGRCAMCRWRHVYDGQHYLQDRYAIQMYAPAAEAGPSSRYAGHPQVRGFGVTKAIAGFAALPAVADEMCYVVRGPIEGLNSTDGACPGPSTGNGALEGKGFVDAAFTAERFEHMGDVPGGFSVLHVGTHFRLRPATRCVPSRCLAMASKDRCHWHHGFPAPSMW